jgi:hypothetical protein
VLNWSFLTVLTVASPGQVPPAADASALTEADAAPTPHAGRTLVVGEFHGTTEIPRTFLDLVRRTARDRPIVVGLELPPSAGRLSCRAGALVPDGWASAQQDGRRSLAMRELVCALRSGSLSRRVRVVFLDDNRGRQDDFDARAAELFRRAMLRRPAAGLILTGSYHARNAPGSLASHLRALGQTVDTLVVSAPAGEAWFCADGGACGRNPVRINFCSQRPGGAERPRWFRVASAGAPWDQCLSIPRVTPSPPAGLR